MNDLSFDPTSGFQAVTFPVGTREWTAATGLSHLLGCEIVLYEGNPQGSSSRKSHSKIVIPKSDLPLNPTTDQKKFQFLLFQRLGKIKNILNFLVECYVKSKQRSKAEWDPECWSNICCGMREAVIGVTLEQLIQGENIPEDDFWSMVLGQDGSVAIYEAFLDLVDGQNGKGTAMPPEMLSELLCRAAENKFGHRAVSSIVRNGTRQIMHFKRIDDIYFEASKCLSKLSPLLEKSEAVNILCNVLAREVEESLASNATYFEAKSFLGQVLAVTPVIAKFSQDVVAGEKYSIYLTMKGFPQLTVSGLNSCNLPVRQGINKCQEFAFQLVRKLTKVKDLGKNNVLGWFAAVIILNEKRTGPRYESEAISKVTSTDGFVVNVCYIMLKMMQSLYTITPTSNLEKILPEYTGSPSCRLIFKEEKCLARGCLDTAEDSTAEKCLPKMSDFNFMTECFHLTQRLLHVGLIPAIDHAFHLLRSSFPPSMKEIEKRFHAVVIAACVAHFLDPSFAVLCTQFYVTFCVWLMMLMEKYKENLDALTDVSSELGEIFSTVPLYTIKDMAKWFNLVATFEPQFFAHMQLTPLVDCCVVLLQHPSLLQDVVTQAKVISILNGFIRTDQRSNRGKRSIDWGSSVGGLSAIVLGSPVVKEHLGPALLESYVAVDTVEGVDVDKEDFEKYGARTEIESILTELWKRGDCRASILQLSGTPKLQKFLRCVLDMLSYLLSESLTRLKDVGRFEKLRRTDREWTPLSQAQKAQKQKFYDMDRRWARGCNIHGERLLKFLAVMIEEDVLAADMCREPLSDQCAACMSEFFELLCGPQASQLNVENKESYHFNPQVMLKNLGFIFCHIWNAQIPGETGFFKSFVSHPDFSLESFVKAKSVLRNHTLLPENLLMILEEISSQLAAVNFDLPVQFDKSLCVGYGNMTIDYQQVTQDYQSTLSEYNYDGIVLHDVHSFASKVKSENMASNPQKVKALLGEIKKLEGLLQTHPDSAIYIRQDENHLDLVRALITGPCDTPYSYGCFLFDMYFPDQYPNIPPLVKIVTTGNNTVRFNPNLYRDGKVCLSLLGTFHGGDASQKWNPKHSSMYQVLISIQSLIMNSEPIYNEPGYGDLSKTPEGRTRSLEYNCRLYPSTIRYAMIEQLRNPPRGFEDVIRQHFGLLKNSVLKMCCKWLEQSVPFPETRKKLEKTFTELHNELKKL